MKTLGEVIEYLAQYGEVEGSEALSEEAQSFVLTALSDQSQQVDHQTLFIAKQGTQVDGLDYVPPQGCWVLTEKAVTEERQQKIQALRVAHPEYRVMEIAGLTQLLASFATWFYDAPSEKLKVLGVTGTNGKSSTTFYSAQLLSNLGYKVGVMGTLGVGVYPDLEPTANTTLESVRLQHLLAMFVAQGVEYVCMEVSSHAIALGRIEGVVFETLALTQVTSDHLDFHQTQTLYEATKQALFEQWHSRCYVLNQADAVGQRILTALSKDAIAPECLLTYSPDPSVPAQLQCTAVSLSEQGIAGVVSLNAQQVSCSVPLWGRFNIENLLCAMGILLQQGVTLEQIQTYLPRLKPVLGRMQKVAASPTVMVDYAHTADGLLQVLQAAKAHQTSGRCLLVFGCGGDRDRAKRPKMGAIARQYADEIYLTNDNPRCEAPQQIVHEILQGMISASNDLSMPSRTGDSEHFWQNLDFENVHVIFDRKQAIQMALRAAEPEDVVLVVGKGHETTQQFCQQVQPFSDVAVIEAALRELAMGEKV